MAFGKNPAGLAQVGSFRQMGHSWSQSRNEKKVRNSSSVPAWINQYRPSTDLPDTIRLIAGDYNVEDVDRNGNVFVVQHLPFYPFTEHYDSRSKKYSVCSAGPFASDRNKKQPCHGCDLFWSSMKEDPQRPGRKKPGFMSKRDMSVFTVIDYNTYHKVEQIDQQTGRVRTNDKGEPYYNWIKCGGRVCDACDAGKETKQGKRLHWAMGSDHYNTLLTSDKDIGRSCVTCGENEVIHMEAWLCTQCGEAVIDDRSRLSEKDIDDIVLKPATCKQCGHHGFLQELINCTNCTSAGREPKRATLFDVDIKVRRVEASDGSNRSTLNVSGFSKPGPVSKTFQEYNKPEELNKIYAPTPLEVQAVLFQVVNREPVPASDLSRPYNNQGNNGPNYG